MLKQRARAVVSFPAGTLLGLDKDQARARRYALTPEGGNLYRSTGTVQFKAGEEFSIEGDPPKAIAALLDAGHAAARNPRKPAAKSARVEAVAPALVDPAQLNIG